MLRADLLRIRDLMLQGADALRRHRGAESRWDEHHFDLPAPPFTGTIDINGYVSLYLDVPDEDEAQRVFNETVAVVESLTEGWEKESDSNAMFGKRHRYVEERGTISVALQLNKELSVVWVFFSPSASP